MPTNNSASNESAPHQDSDTSTLQVSNSPPLLLEEFAESWATPHSDPNETCCNIGYPNHDCQFNATESEADTCINNEADEDPIQSWISRMIANLRQVRANKGRADYVHLAEAKQVPSNPGPDQSLQPQGMETPTQSPYQMSSLQIMELERSTNVADPESFFTQQPVAIAATASTAAFALFQGTNKETGNLQYLLQGMGNGWGSLAFSGDDDPTIDFTDTSAFILPKNYLARYKRYDLCGLKFNKTKLFLLDEEVPDIPGVIWKHGVAGSIPLYYDNSNYLASILKQSIRLVPRIFTNGKGAAVGKGRDASSAKDND